MRVLGVMYFFIIANYQSFSATSIHIPRSHCTLIATKNSKQHKYNIGTHVSIRYNNYSQKLSGQLYNATEDSVVIKVNSKKTDLKSIAINDICSVSVLHKKGRKNWVVFTSLLFILMTLGLVLYNKGVLISLPVLVLPVVSIYTFVPFLCINFMSDILSKKSIKNGWSFKAVVSK
jgi:hypothetical protein